MPVLTIILNRMNRDDVFFAIGEAGLSESWDVGKRSDSICVNLDTSDLLYVSTMLIELTKANVEFSLNNSPDAIYKAD